MATPTAVPHSSVDSNLNKRIGPPHNVIGKPLKSILKPLSPYDTGSNNNNSNLPIFSATVETSAVDESESAVLQSDISVVYAFHTFVASLDGQVSVLKGDSLVLLDDSNSYWWLIRCLKTGEVGYIPAENIETQQERTARLNKQRNVRLTMADDLLLDSPIQEQSPTADPGLPLAALKSPEGNREKMGTLQGFTIAPKQDSLSRIPRLKAKQHGSGSLSQSQKSLGVSKTVQFSTNVVVVTHSDDEEDSFDEEDIDEDAIEEKQKGDSLVKKVQDWGTKRIKKWRHRFTRSNSASSVGSNESIEAEEKPSTEANSKSASKESLHKGSNKTSRKRSSSLQGTDAERGAENAHAVVQQVRADAQAIQKARPRSLSEGRPTVDPESLRQGDEQLSSESLLVLKIFSGNYDFKATYKTVSVSKGTTVGEVLHLTLTRFKVFNSSNTPVALPPLPNLQGSIENTAKVEKKEEPMIMSQNIDSENNYYLSVVHGDSKERKLSNQDNILDVLLRLQSKSILPGVAPSSQKEIIKHMKHVTSGGKVSSIRTPNDSEIKFLLNMKMVQDGEISLNGPIFIRVYFYDENANSTSMQTYKTIAVKSDSCVKDVIKQSLKKFKITVPADMTSSGYSLCKAKEHLIALVGTESQNNIASLNTIDVFSQGVRAVKSLIEPDTVLGDDVNMGAVFRDIYDVNAQELGATEELSFVLRGPSLQESQTKDSRTSAPTQKPTRQGNSPTTSPVRPRKEPNGKSAPASPKRPSLVERSPLGRSTSENILSPDDPAMGNRSLNEANIVAQDSFEYSMVHPDISPVSHIINAYSVDMETIKSGKTSSDASLGSVYASSVGSMNSLSTDKSRRLDRRTSSNKNQSAGSLSFGGDDGMGRDFSDNHVDYLNALLGKSVSGQSITLKHSNSTKHSSTSTSEVSGGGGKKSVIVESLTEEQDMIGDSERTLARDISDRTVKDPSLADLKTDRLEKLVTELEIESKRTGLSPNSPSSETVPEQIKRPSITMTAQAMMNSKKLHQELSKIRTAWKSPDISSPLTLEDQKDINKTTAL